MMVAGSVLLLVVTGVTCILAVVLVRENRKLQNLAQYGEVLKRFSADLAALRKQHLALDELVSQWMSRSAVRAKRARKEERSEEEEAGNEPEGIFFPSLVKNADTG